MRRLLVGRTSKRLSLWCAVLLAVVLAALSPVLPYVFSYRPRCARPPDRLVC